MQSHLKIYAELLGVASTPSSHERERIECTEGRIPLLSMYETMPETVIATCGLPRSIQLWLPDDWQPILQFMLHQEPAAVGLDTATFAALRRVMLGNAVSIEIGNDGAIQLPEHLCEFAGITDVAYWRHLGSVIELLAAPTTSN